MNAGVPPAPPGDASMASPAAKAALTKLDTSSVFKVEARSPRLANSRGPDNKDSAFTDVGSTNEGAGSFKAGASSVDAATSPRSGKAVSVWGRSFRNSDPRWQVMEFFRPGDRRGPLGYLRRHNLVPEGEVSEYFTVWRPTSMSAIRMMIEGNATGKGLNVKGKSAKSGCLSGFVPFLQISEEDHKALVCSRRFEGRVRVYFQSEALREEAIQNLKVVMAEMRVTAQHARMLADGVTEGTVSLTDELHEKALRDTQLDMERPEIDKIDTFATRAYGLEIPERLMWEAFVVRQDISHPEGWDTLRPSEPAFMDMNMHAMREDSQPLAVIWQWDQAKPMNPRGLLVAYEEDQVRPVASDMDAFLMGSKGLDFQPLPSEQVDLVNWLLDNIDERVLAQPNSAPWTKRWLEVLKAEAKRGFHPELPRFGFGDPTSYEIMASAVNQLRISGAVRHGAECFNFYFPQDLDENFLIIWQGFEKVPWRYVHPDGLREFLLNRIEDGFSFPMNPKWVLCDEGFYELFDKLDKSPQAQKSLSAWFPAESGLRERLREIHEKYPNGFVRTALGAGEQPESLLADHDAAQWELKRFMTLQRAKRKMSAIIRLRAGARRASMAKEAIAKAVAEEEAQAQQQSAETSSESEPEADDVAAPAANGVVDDAASEVASAPTANGEALSDGSVKTPAKTADVPATDPAASNGVTEKGPA